MCNSINNLIKIRKNGWYFNSLLSIKLSIKLIDDPLPPDPESEKLPDPEEAAVCLCGQCRFFEFPSTER